MSGGECDCGSGRFLPVDYLVLLLGVSPASKPTRCIRLESGINPNAIIPADTAKKFRSRIRIPAQQQITPQQRSARGSGHRAAKARAAGWLGLHSTAQSRDRRTRRRARHRAGTARPPGWSRRSLKRPIHRRANRAPTKSDCGGHRSADNCARPGGAPRTLDQSGAKAGADNHADRAAHTVGDRHKQELDT